MTNENRDRSAERVGRIGSSDVGAILPGIEHPYRSPLAVYQVVRGTYEGDDLSSSLHVRIGCDLEQMGLDAYAERTGREVKKLGTLDCPAFKFLGCTVDGYCPETRTIVEVKCTFAGWTEPPPYHWAQVRWQGTILETNDITVDELCVVVVRLGGFAPVIEYHVRRFEDCREQATKEFAYIVDWWSRHIEKSSPPDATGESVRDGSAGRQYPQRETAIIEADDEQTEAIRTYAKWRDRREFAELQEREAKAQLMSIIGEMKGIERAGLGRVTWSERKPSSRVDYKAITKELEPDEAIIERHTRISSGGRTFRWTKAKQQEET